MLKVAKFLFMVIHRRNKTKWLNLAIKLLIVAKATLIVIDKCHLSKWALVFYSSDTHYWTLSRSYPALFVIPFKMHWSSKVTSWWILPIPVVYPNPHQAWLPNHPIILLRSVLRRRTKSICYLSISQRSYIQTSPFSLHVRGRSYPHVEWSHRKSLPDDSPLIIEALFLIFKKISFSFCPLSFGRHDNVILKFWLLTLCYMRLNLLK